ncbi:MAG: hypothetical protein J6K28_07115 [Alistipes sp.]|nr:hypothetical protein [Alistipes sp.]
MKSYNLKTATKRLLFMAGVSLTSLFVTSCVVDEDDHVSDVDLGAAVPNKVLTLKAEAGTADIEVYSNKTYKVRLISGEEWVSLKKTPSSEASEELILDGNGKFTIDYDRNARFRRMAKIVLAAETRRDTISIRQEGVLSSDISIPDSRMFVEKTGGKMRTRFISKVDFADVAIDVEYTDLNEVDWIADFERNNNYVDFTVGENLGNNISRKALVTFSYKDGWGETVSDVLTITQSGPDSENSEIISFEELRQLEGLVDENIAIEGYIVSDITYGNASDNPHTSKVTIDYTHTNLCAYLESLDGRYGVRLEFNTEDDYVFSRYDKVRLNLQGTTVVKEGSSNPSDMNPVRYAISDLTSENVATIEGGSMSWLPVKEKHFGDLTDDDMYTYVTLKDCEFPVRKGPLTPINEGYAKEYAVNRISKYPLLVRDINGNSFYTFTNITCTYRRTGDRLPQGSGDLSGVIVFEYYDRFTWDVNKCDEYRAMGYDEDQIFDLGNIGRYQIRHQSADDINIADNFNEGFSDIVCEFNYYNQTRTDVEKTVSEVGVMSASYGAGTLTHSSATSTATGILPTQEYSYLGPVGKSNPGNVNGTGVVDRNGNRVSVSPNTNNQTSNAGKGWVESSDGMAWYHNKWVNGSSFHYWLMSFSTSKVSAGRHLSLQISCLNKNQGKAPRYWNVEWSTDRTNWTFIDSYTCPDVVLYDYTTYHQSAAYKYINVDLPDEMANRSVVYIRLIPSNERAGNPNSPYSYDDGEVVDGGYNSLNYLAVRYNK